MRKRSPEELAIFGGPAAFQEPLHVGRPNVKNRQRFIERVENILDSHWLTNNGPMVDEWESRLSDYLDVKHAVLTCNGTIALQVAAHALELEGEVIVPSFTFVATAHALSWLGIQPVFCDIDPQTYNIDPKCAEALITPKTTGIIGVHVFGRPCAIEELSEIADRRGLKLLFDAAHALGCTRRQTRIGNFGDAEVLSFHATKFVNAFEGGAIVTNDDRLAERMRLMRNFGFADYDTVASTGTNAKMSEVSAAMGLSCFEAIDEIVETNQLIYKAYQKGLANISGLSLIEYDGSEASNFQYVAVEIDPAIAGFQRDHGVEVLFAERVLARRYFYPGCHRMQPYASTKTHAGPSLPITDAVASRVMLLPTGTAIDTEDVEAICEILRCLFEHTEDVSRRLRSAKQ